MKVTLEHDAEGHMLLSVAEVAKAMGLTQTRIRQLIAAKEIPAIQVGRRYRVPRAALEEWLDQLSVDALAHVGMTFRD